MGLAVQGGIQHVFETFATSNQALAVILAAIVSGTGWLIARALRARIGWSVSHGHAFNVPNPPNGSTLFYTKEIWIQNLGRDVAEAIEVVFPCPPAHFDIWPLRIYKTVQNPDGSFVIQFENLNSREYVTVSLFQIATPAPDLATIRFRGGVGRWVPMGPQQIFPRPTILAVRFLILFGGFSLAFFVINHLL